MCEGIFKKLAEKDYNIVVSSAGINAFNGVPASEDAISALEEMNIDISNHTSKRLTVEDIEEADLIITMTSVHKMLILNACPNAKDKVFTLCEYAKGEKGDITDPYGMGEDVYRKCAQELKSLLEVVLSKVK